MIAQGAWRRMFHEICGNKKLAGVISNIFNESNDQKKIEFVDQLYKMNEGRKNNLTGRSGNAINAMLAAYDPMKNTSVISLKDRKLLIEYFEFPMTFDFDKASSGMQFIETNRILLDNFRAAGAIGSARTISRFCYSEKVKPLWKGEHTVKRFDKNVDVTIPTDTEVEETATIEPEELKDSMRMQAMVAEIGTSRLTYGFLSRIGQEFSKNGNQRREYYLKGSL